MTLGWVVDVDGVPLIYGEPASGTKAARLLTDAGNRFVPDDIQEGASGRAEALALKAAMQGPQ